MRIGFLPDNSTNTIQFSLRYLNCSNQNSFSLLCAGIFIGGQSQLFYAQLTQNMTPVAPSAANSPAVFSLSNNNSTLPVNLILQGPLSIQGIPNQSYHRTIEVRVLHPAISTFNISIAQEADADSDMLYAYNLSNIDSVLLSTTSGPSNTITLTINYDHFNHKYERIE